MAIQLSKPLPWRAFKGYHQLWSLHYLPTLISKYESVPGLFRFTRDIPEATIHNIDLLISENLVTLKFNDDKTRLLGYELVADTVSAGFEAVFDGLETGEDVTVAMPSSRSVKGRAWLATSGLCAYCGTALTLFGKDALSQLPPPRQDEEMWACKSCESSKNTLRYEDLSLDGLRERLCQKRFELAHGFRFSAQQIDFLESIGVAREQLGLDVQSFYFEQLEARAE
jgi:hypothetical protein